MGGEKAAQSVQSGYGKKRGGGMWRVIHARVRLK